MADNNYLSPSLVQQGYTGTTGATPYRPATSAQVAELQSLYGMSFSGVARQAPTGTTQLTLNFDGTQNNGDVVPTGYTATNIAVLNRLLPLNRTSYQIESAHAMVELKDRCSLRPARPQVRLLFLAWLLGPMLVACHPPDKEFRIELPDVSFVVERDWVPPHVRAQAVASFEVNIPYSRVPKETVELALAVQRREYGFELNERTYRIQLEYKPTPQPGELFDKLQKRPGWKLLPEGTDLNYRVGAEDDPRPASAGPTTWYELKSDPRYVIMCGSIWDGRRNGKTIDSCSVSVPYREFAGTHCTQLEFGFRKREMGRWAEIAQRKRDVIRQFEFNSIQTKSQQGK